MTSISSAALANGLSQLQQIFAKADKDKTGALAKTEFTTAVANIPGLGNADALFKKLDTDANGQVSQSELTSGAELAQKVQDALLKAQELMSGGTLMDLIGGKSAMAQAKAAESSGISTMFTANSGSSGSSGMDQFIQQVMAQYKATEDAAAAKPATTGINTAV